MNMEVIEDCLICSSPMNEQPWTQMSQVCCNAKIHLSCLEKNVILNSHSCPFCRKKLTKEDLDKLLLNIPEEAKEENLQFLDEALVASDAETVVDEADFNHNFAPPELLSEDAQDTSIPGTAFMHEQEEVQSLEDQLSEGQKCIPSNWWFCHLHKSKFSNCPLYLKLSPDSRKTVLRQYYGCLICTNTDHITPFCKSNRSCQNCQSRSHHETICDVTN